VYIYDYLLKRNLQTTAKAFMAEGKVAADPVGNHRRCFCYLVFCICFRFGFCLQQTRALLSSGDVDSNFEANVSLGA
jgi:hypothetical protein